MEKEICQPNVALVVGVTGMAGLSLAEALKSPTALGGPWKVYGCARRPKPTWYPQSLIDQYITLDATILDDTRDKLAPVAHEVSHVFWVAIQVRESEEENITVNSAMLANVLNVLRSAPASRLTHITLQTGTKHYMGPIFDPAHTGHLKSHDPPFHEEMARLPYPNFYYALEDLVASHAPLLTYSVHRSSIIMGSSLRSAYNLPLKLAVYATICRYEGLPFRFPGTQYAWNHFCDMTDARVLAEQHVWAAVTAHAKNQAFNCSNGDVFTWKRLWLEFSELFEVEFVPFDEEDEFDFMGMMKGKEKVWDEIVEKYGLIESKEEGITCFDGLTLVLSFGFQHVCSMNKSREFGFHGYANTVKNLRLWVKRWREMKFIP